MGEKQAVRLYRQGGQVSNARFNPNNIQHEANSVLGGMHGAWYRLFDDWLLMQVQWQVDDWASVVSLRRQRRAVVLLNSDNLEHWFIAFRLANQESDNWRFMTKERYSMPECGIIHELTRGWLSNNSAVFVKCMEGSV